MDEPNRQPKKFLDLRDILAEALDVVADGVIVIDSEQRVLFFNRGAELIFGYPASEMVGQYLGRLMLPGFALAHHAQLRAFAASEDDSRPMGRPGQVRGLRRDGSEFPAEADGIEARARRADRLYGDHPGYPRPPAQRGSLAGQ